MSDFAVILAQEIDRMTVHIERCRMERDQMQKGEDYVVNKTLVRACVSLSIEIGNKQNARTALKQALAAYTKAMK